MADRRQLLNDPEEVFRIGFEGHQARLWTALPCIVQSVNFAKMTLEAQPSIQGLMYLDDGTSKYVNLPLVVDVPICFPSAGGFTLTLPIKAGDEVLVVFASRAIDSWWQSGGIGVPVEMRMHDLSDGFAIPGPKSVPNVIANISTSNAQLRNDAGTAYLEITSDGKVNVHAATIGLTGTLAITGNLTVTGNLTATGEVKAGPLAIPLSTHVHTGVTPGGGTTGTPTP